TAAALLDLEGVAGAALGVAAVLVDREVDTPERHDVTVDDEMVDLHRFEHLATAEVRVTPAPVLQNAGVGPGGHHVRSGLPLDGGQGTGVVPMGLHAE